MSYISDFSGSESDDDYVTYSNNSSDYTRGNSTNYRCVVTGPTFLGGVVGGKYNGAISRSTFSGGSVAIGGKCNGAIFGKNVSTGAFNGKLNNVQLKCDAIQNNLLIGDVVITVKYPHLMKYQSKGKNKVKALLLFYKIFVNQ